MSDVKPRAVKNVVSAVYALLGRPSDIRLPLIDVRSAINDEAIEMVEELAQGAREQRTARLLVTPERDPDGIDWIVRVPDCPDFEVRGFEYSPNGLTTQGGEAVFYGVEMPSEDMWSKAMGADYVAAEFYGSSAIPDGVKVRINQVDTLVNSCAWRVSYRMPLYVQLQMGDAPPIPQQFIPYLRYRAALACISMVQDTTAEWKDFVKDNEPRWVAKMLRSEELWKAHVQRSNLPTTVLRTPWNEFRKLGRGVNPRARLPRQ